MSRRDRRRLETRERLFRVAVKLFAEKGYAGTTVEDITESADVAKGTFFNYFPTKEHVLRYFGEQQVSRIASWLESTRQSNTSARDSLRRLVASASELPGANPEIVRAMVGAFVAQPDIRAFLKQELAIGRGLLAEYLKQAQKRGEVRRDITVEAMARTFQQSVFGALLFWSLHEDIPLKDYVESTFQILWSGMACEGPAKNSLRPPKAK